MSNQFSTAKYVDHEILDGDGKKIGEIRVKPGGILWSKKGAHKWMRVSLENFSDFMEEYGREQKK